VGEFVDSIVEFPSRRFLFGREEQVLDATRSLLWWLTVLARRGQAVD
jgi:hypothetical protein